MGDLEERAGRLLVRIMHAVNAADYTMRLLYKAVLLDYLHS